MALQYSPKIVTDSLVMCLDPSQNKSYPTTDLPVKNGLLVWLDAADDSTFSYSSGTEVSQWRDKSGNNFHANQATVANQPSRNTVVNSRKSVNFNSANADRLRVNSGMVFTNSVTAIVFIKPGTQNFAYADILDQDHAMDGVNGWVIQRNNTASQWLIWLANEAGTTWLNTNAVSYADNTPQIVTLRKGSSTLTLSSNGTSSGDVAVADQQIRQANYFGLNIGTWRAGNELYATSRHYNGEICEILVYNRALSLTELKQIHTYLGQKWGISNTDRQIFDLSGNNFNFSFNGTNPRYNAKTIVSNFNTTSPYAVSSFGGQNLTSNILNLLYSDHTIEVAFNAKGFRSVYSYDNTLTTQDGQCIVLWTGQHSGLRVFQNTIIYEYWNSQSSTVGIGVSISSYIDKIIYITATRTGNTLRIYINGVLASGPTTVAATTSPIPYSQINIGAAYQGNPTTQGYIWAGQHEYHLLRMYNRQLTDTEVASNYQAFKARFDNNIVRFGLIMELDAGNPYSYAGAGTTWYDVSGNNKIGTLTGGVTYSSIYGGDFILDGVNGYIQTDLNQNTDNAQITWEAWFWDNSSGGFLDNTAIISNYGPNATTPFTILHMISDGRPYFVQRNSSATEEAVYGSTSICNSIWHHVVGVVDNSNMLIYVDGVLQQTKTKINGTTTSGQNLVIGGNHLGRYQSCRIASARCYNIALSAAQVLQNYNATKGRFGL